LQLAHQAGHVHGPIRADQGGGRPRLLLKYCRCATNGEAAWPRYIGSSLLDHVGQLVREQARPRSRSGCVLPGAKYDVPPDCVR
jgi:hypothetical protein